MTGPALRWIAPLAASIACHVAAAVLLSSLAAPIPGPCVEDRPLFLVMDADCAASEPDWFSDEVFAPVLESAPLLPVVQATPGQDGGESGSQSSPSAITQTAARGHPNGRGEPATTFFRLPAQGSRIVFVLDRSGSMGPEGRLERARRELLASIEELPADAEFHLIAYNRQLASFPRATELSPASREGKGAARDFLESLFPEGGTDHRPALERAIRLRPDVVYFLTDADDLEHSLVESLTRMNAGRAVIHAIEMDLANRGWPGMPMKRLALENKGEYRAVSALVD